MENNEFDLISVGAGAAGLNIASFMNKAGFKVLLIDKADKKIGGDCLNYGCIPSKALIHLSRIARDAKISEEIGLKVSGSVDIKKAMAYVSNKVEHIRKHENAAHFRKQGITVVLGEAKFVSKNEIEVSGKKYKGKKIIIATGSKPRSLDLPGIDKIDTYTNETIFNIEKLPRRLLIIGGGPIGVELGQAFSRLGSKVTILQRGSQFLPKENPEVAQILKEKLEKEGIAIKFGTEPLKFPTKTSVIVKSQNKTETLNFDSALISIGRVLNLPEGLEKASVKIKDGKIITNDRLETTNKDILVSGDALGSLQFTHATELHASIIISNFFSPFKKSLSYKNFSWVTYTDPEIATFGLSEQEIKYQGLQYHKIEQNYEETDRGITDSAKGKLIIYLDNKKKHLLGGTLIAPNAGEIFQELVLAKSARLPIKAIFNKIYPYPTAARINKFAISKVYSEKLTDKTKSILQKLFNWFS